MKESLQRILSNEGEGILLRQPRSLYESGRSLNLLKLKVTKTNKKEEEGFVNVLSRLQGEILRL